MSARQLRDADVQYDDGMKRMTVSLPDDLAAAVKVAAGGEGKVSAYVAAALAEYQNRETLDEILASWERETPVPEQLRQQVADEMHAAGIAASTGRRRRTAS